MLTKIGISCRTQTGALKMKENVKLQLDQGLIRVCHVAPIRLPVTAHKGALRTKTRPPTLVLHIGEQT
jgi:hypothetical protein